MTTTTLSRRLTMHLASGGPKNHSEQIHGSKLTRQELVNNTEILRIETDFPRLQIIEALLIRKESPLINSQSTGTARTLKLLGGNT